LKIKFNDVESEASLEPIDIFESALSLAEDRRRDRVRYGRSIQGTG
jgi:hypothetical protein